MRVTLTLTREMLATKADDKEIWETYQKSKAPPERPDEEFLTAPAEPAGKTVFFRVEGVPVIDDYMIKGFFKDACSALNRCDKEVRGGLEKLAAHKSKIDGCIFVFPQYIPLILPKGESIGTCQRPLRVSDAAGQRVCLAMSESAPVGTTIAFDLVVMAKELKPYVSLWLSYGHYRGLGQWRNGGKGRFSFKITN